MLPHTSSLSNMAAQAESAVLRGLRDVLLRVHKAAEKSGRPVSAVGECCLLRGCEKTFVKV